MVMLRRMTTFEMEVRKNLEKMRAGDVGWREVLNGEEQFKSAAHFISRLPAPDLPRYLLSAEQRAWMMG